MTLTMIPSSSANAKGQDAINETAHTLHELKKCKYCNYKHWDELDLRFHQEMHKEYCEENEINRQKRREYEIMLMKRLSLKREIRLLHQSFATNEMEIKIYETDEHTKELAHEVRERVRENRTRGNWDSDTSYTDEYLDLGNYVLTDRESELAAVTSSL